MLKSMLSHIRHDSSSSSDSSDNRSTKKGIFFFISTIYWFFCIHKLLAKLSNMCMIYVLTITGANFNNHQANTNEHVNPYAIPDANWYGYPPVDNYYPYNMQPMYPVRGHPANYIPFPPRGRGNFRGGPGPSRGLCAWIICQF